MGIDLLDLAPVPGLRAAASILLNVWDALQNIDVHFFLLIFLFHFFSLFLFKNTCLHNLAHHV